MCMSAGIAQALLLSDEESGVRSQEPEQKPTGKVASARIVGLSEVSLTRRSMARRFFYSDS
jgi:hypothetical protein